MGTIIMLIVIIVVAVLPALKDRVFHVKRLLISPVIFSILLYSTIHRQFSLDMYSIAVISVAAVIGVTLGALLRWNAEVAADREQQLIALKGSYFSLFLFLVIFAAHFVAEFWLGMNAAVSQPGLSQFIILGLLCGSSCLSAGVASRRFYQYSTTKPSQLNIVKTVS